MVHFTAAHTIMWQAVVTSRCNKTTYLHPPVILLLPFTL